MFLKVICPPSMTLIVRTVCRTLAWVSVVPLSVVPVPVAQAAAHRLPAPLITTTSSQQTSPNATALELNVPIERELTGGQKHAYHVTLSEGQYAGVTVEQRGIDVVVRWLGPDAKQVVEFDSEIRAQGEERTGLVAETAGRYTLSVEARRQKAPAGVYSVRLGELRAATDKDRRVQEARRLSAESVSLFRSGKYDEAQTIGERALEIRESELGREHSDVAFSLTLLGTIEYNKTAFANAEKLHQRALDIREKALGPEHPDVATSLHNLANTHRNRADFVKAEQFDRRAMKIFEEALGPEHPSVATTANTLASLYKNIGDFVKAEQFNRRSLEIWQKTLGPDDPYVAYALHNLGKLYGDAGDFEKAERLHRQGLEIREKVFPPDHPDVAASLYYLACLYVDMGDFERAETLQQRSLQIVQKALGPEHVGVAASLDNLGIIRYNRGDFAAAEAFHQRALEILEKEVGPGNPDVAEALNNLVNVHAAMGKIDLAIRLQSRANEIMEGSLAFNLATGSERQKLAYLTSLSAATYRTVSLHVRAAPDNSIAQELAATAILQRKGRVLDVMSDNRSTLRRRLTEQDQTLLDRLNDNAAHLARLVLNGPQRMTLAEHQQQVRTLEEEREDLESDLSRRSAGFYERSTPVTLAAIQSAVPSKGALIEFFAYRPFYPEAGPKKAYGNPRYVAYVVCPQGDVKWKELGEAKQIDDTIDELRTALRNPNRRDVRRIARKLDESVMQPVRALLGDATHLLVSPDGALNLIPFEALVDEQSRCLVERYSFTYLTSGRDLLRLQVPRLSLSKAVVMANPLYGEPETSALALSSVGSRPVGRVPKRQSGTTGTDLTSVYFAPLSATAQEAQAIKAQFADATVWTGMQATESALKQMAGPRLLHIATHGFFLQDGPQDSIISNRSETRAINVNVKIDNPLLRSGLALAGANLRRGGPDDGVLTALEASGLNLWGTKLVVLSGCDTGIGEVKTGEGVYGLRRAFVLAGTEALVMSLWQVSDYVTRELMTNYYKGLRQGRGRGEALRQVQLSMLKQKGRAHPFYWASFIQSGEWGNLDGKR
jgi:CHAT domain-containing protein/Tfp pilus assembly protein PilF